MPLQLREYQKNDFIALKNIIRKTWRYDEFSSPKTASRLADVFLSSCLTNYTFSRVAVLNGKPVGIILVKDIARHTCPLPNRFRQLRAVLSLYLTKEGRAVSKIFENVTGIDRELLRESCCFSKRMRKFFRKNEKSMLQFCNKNSKRKGRLQWVKKPL